MGPPPLDAASPVNVGADMPSAEAGGTRAEQLNDKLTQSFTTTLMLEMISEQQGEEGELADDFMQDD